MGYVQSLCLSGKANEVPQVPNIICSGKLREKGVLGSVQGIGEEGQSHCVEEWQMGMQ